MKTDVLIIFPPQWPPVSPYSALPLLRAGLQKKGIAANLLDLNCAAYDLLLTEKYLRTLNLPVRFHSTDPRHPFEWLLSFKDELASRVEDAKKTMRSGDCFFDAKQYLRAENTLRYSLFLVSLAFWPQTVGLDSLDLGMPSSHLFTAGQMERPFGTFVFEDTMDGILATELSDRYDVVGFSVHTRFQLFYSLRLIRRYFRGGLRRPHVTLGGTLLKSLHKYCSAFQPLFDAGVDTVVYSRGDEALAQLCRRLSEGKDYSSCQGIIYSDGHSVKKNGHAGNCRDAASVDLDYSGLPLDRYLSPSLIVNIPASTGCYWGKCRFCNYHDLYSVLDPGRLCALMERLGRIHGTQYFFLAQSTLDYGQVLALPSFPSFLPENTWASLARIDESVSIESAHRLYISGCRKLSFGLETGSPALREKMNKGPLSKDLEPFLQRCHEKGIGVELFLITGFPGETMQDVRRTIEFVRRFLPCLDSLSANEFSLVCNSVLFPIMRQRDEYTIDTTPLSFFDILDQHRPWHYRHKRRAAFHDQRVSIFWDGLIRIAEESATHIWRGNTAFRAGLPRLPEHQFLYLASTGRVKNTGAIASAQQRMIPFAIGETTVWVDRETMTIACDSNEN